ncbi:MAG: hypothetical protein WA884_06650 [Methyloceanibacter sp.]
MSETEKSAETPSESAEEAPLLSFAEFLESTPLGQSVKVAGLANYRDGRIELSRPEIQLHCTSDQCNGPRFFRYAGGPTIMANLDQLTFVTYICSNCRSTKKVFALHPQREEAFSEEGFAYKFGEDPSYGPPTPNRLLRLFGSDRELFLKGRRSENQGLGIGAFTYYRRVVENHKDRLLEEVIKVAQKVGAPVEMVQTLEAAKDEISFSKALDAAKNAIPQTLLIKGHNPLTLLHKALSGGVHEKTDQQCLELAQDVRVVLIALAERLSQVLEEETELTTAVRRLLAANEKEENDPS